MGCDIHMYVEYKSFDDKYTDWHCGDYFQIDDPVTDKPAIKRIELSGDRDYDLFAVLADVRNYDLVDYIAEPKGLPNDATEFVKREYSDWAGDAHSCSYFTLQELIEYQEENNPVDFLGHSILQPLIDKLKQRANDLNLIWDFEWKKDSVHEKANYIRIVFWFDN